MSPALHIICGRCGANDEFTYSTETDEEGVHVYIYCANCSTLTGLDEVLKEKE